jgi:hypothetical protein
MTRKITGTGMFAVVLTAAALTMASALPAQAVSPAIGTGYLMTDTYWATAAHTGTPVGYHTWGYCPELVSIVSGTSSAYITASTQPCP